MAPVLPHGDFAERFWDLGRLVSSNESYTDFEGLAGDAHVRYILASPTVKYRLVCYEADTRTPAALLKDLLVHYVYENDDQGGYKVTVAEATAFIDTAAWLLHTRWWMKAPEYYPPDQHDI